MPDYRAPVRRRRDEYEAVNRLALSLLVRLGMLLLVPFAGLLTLLGVLFRPRLRALDLWLLGEVSSKGLPNIQTPCSGSEVLVLYREFWWT